MAYETYIHGIKIEADGNLKSPSVFRVKYPHIRYNASRSDYLDRVEALSKEEPTVIYEIVDRMSAYRSQTVVCYVAGNEVKIENIHATLATINRGITPKYRVVFFGTGFGGVEGYSEHISYQSGSLRFIKENHRGTATWRHDANMVVIDNDDKVVWAKLDGTVWKSGDPRTGYKTALEIREGMMTRNMVRGMVKGWNPLIKDESFRQEPKHFGSDLRRAGQHIRDNVLDVMQYDSRMPASKLMKRLADVLVEIGQEFENID